MFKGVFFTLLILFPLALAEEIIFKPTETSGSFLAEVTDPTNQWIFKNDNGYLGIMKFEQDGTISGYVSDYNEKYWRIENGALTILNKDKNPSCRFVQIFKDFAGKWHAQGLYIGSSNGWRHYIQEIWSNWLYILKIK